MQRRAEMMGNVFTGGERRSWQDIDRELRALAKRQRALDAEEAILLCAVVRREIWRQLGKASLLEYLEEVLGYGPKAAKERVRVAMALDELPMLHAALENGEQSYSAVVEPDPADLQPAQPMTPPHQPHVGHAESRHGDPSNYDWTVKKTQAMQALKQLDIALPEARAFVEQAAQQLPRNVTFEQLFRAALRVFRQSQPAFVSTTAAVRGANK